MILRYRLEKFHKNLVFQVLYTTPSFRRVEGRATELYTLSSLPGTGLLSIKSVDVPEIGNSRSLSVYLWGRNREGDFSVHTREYPSNIDRDIQFNLIQRSLTYWAERLTMWNERVNPGSPVVVADSKDPAIPGRGRCFELYLP